MNLGDTECYTQRYTSWPNIQEPWGIEAPLDSMNSLVPITDSKMRGSVVSCEMRSELYLDLVIGIASLNNSASQAPMGFFNVPDTVTTTIFPAL